MKTKIYPFLFPLLIMPYLSQAQYEFQDSASLADPCGMFHQITYRELAEPFTRKRFCWADWEIPVSSQKKYELFGKLVPRDKLGNYYYIVDEDTISHTGTTPGNIRLIDYNNDGLPDIISEYWVAWDKKLNLEFWKNTGKVYLFDIRLQGDILEMNRDAETGNTEFLLYHILCCGDITHHIKRFIISRDSGTFHLAARYAFTGRIDRSELDPVEPSFDFVFSKDDTLYENIHRRFKPNTIITRGVKGTVLYQLKQPDNTGWYLVQLEPDAILLKSKMEYDFRLNERFKGTPETYLGFVKKASVQVKK